MMVEDIYYINPVTPAGVNIVTRRHGCKHELPNWPGQGA
jgi:hypothetical protein